MAYALGLIPKKLHTELEKLRRLRNAFAHSDRILNFEDAEVAALFASLERPSGSTARRSAGALMEWLKEVSKSIEEHGHQAEGPRGLKWAKRYASRVGRGSS